MTQGPFIISAGGRFAAVQRSASDAAFSHAPLAVDPESARWQLGASLLAGALFLTIAGLVLLEADRPPQLSTDFARPAIQAGK